MTITISYATNDGYIESSTTGGHTAAQIWAGSAETFTATNNSTSLPYGNRGATGFAGTYQSFLEFPYTLVSTDVRVDAYVVTTGLTHPITSSADDTVTMLEYDWGGGTVTTADWRTPAQLQALTGVGRVFAIDESGTKKTYLGGPNLRTRLDTTGTLRVLVTTSANINEINDFPFGSANSFAASETSGTASDPVLVWRTVPQSTLVKVAGASVQLSDGTNVFLESNGSATPTFLLRYYSSGSATTIATLSGFAPGAGLQGLGLCRDASDNLYVVGEVSSNVLGAKAYTKGVGLTWTAQTTLSTSMANYADTINNVACAWQNKGTNGTISVVLSHAVGQGISSPGNSQQYAQLSCQALLAGSGTLLRGSGLPTLFLNQTSDATLYHTFFNPTGTGLDIVTRTDDHTYAYAAGYDSNDTVTFGRFGLSTAGVVNTTTCRSSDGTAISRDANSKVRICYIGGDTVAVVHGDRVVIARPNGATFDVLATVNLASEGMTTFPTRSTLIATAAWDVFYDAGLNLLWFYYFSVADGRRLMKTSIDLDTNLATGDEDEVQAAVGAVGSTNLALRLPRGPVNEQSILVSVANRASGGTLSTVYILDSSNVAPTAPTLTPKANFDAATAGTFTWTFNDPNTNDSQTAYQIDINTSGGVDTYDSGKVASTTSQHVLTAATLSNPGTWQWRVRTYDEQDVVSPWSDYATFSTAAGGTVTITDPATDNPAGVITDDYAIDWSLAGATQVEYRVTAIRTDTSAQLVDTGWVTSPATTYNVTGMLTDVEYQITVKTRNSGIESNPDSVLITPSYGTPEEPEVVVTAVNDDGYLLVEINNPAPQGDRPEVTVNYLYRREADTADDYTLIATVDPDGEYRDYATASGVTYEYKVRGIAP